MIEMPNGLMAREGTSDEGTWHDVFDTDKGWHRPPDWLKPEAIVDLGAYVGYTTLDFIDQYDDCFVLAVEPDLSNFHMLCQHIENTKKQPYVTVDNSAIWNYNGRGRLDGDAYNAKTLTKGAMVRVLTIDNLLQFFGLEKVDYLKMDIEGSEREVLRDGGNWVNKVKCIKVEVHGEYTVDECITNLHSIGFDKYEAYYAHHCVVGWNE